MIYTTAIDKIRKVEGRKKIIQGGSSSGKTYAILTILIDISTREAGKSISVVSESMPHLRRGAVRDFLNIMKETGRYYDDHFNKTNLTYTFGNGSYMEFFSADNPDKLKGARRDILYINECNNVGYEAYQQLSIRTHEDIYLDYNPDRQFWAITDVMNEADARRIILNYMDNEALSPSVIEQFNINRAKAQTSDYWKNWCKVYIDGEVGSLEGVIFTNWQLCDGMPGEAHLVGVGLDFGFTNDPSTAVAVWRADGVYYLDELFYGTNMTNATINGMLSGCDIGRDIEIWADSAEPKSIKELKNYGWRIGPVTKGPDSIVWGIGVMQEQILRVTRKSQNLINELENYQWIKDNWGLKTNKPIATWNHAIDAARYLFMMKVGKKNGNKTPFVIGTGSGGNKKLPF